MPGDDARWAMYAPEAYRAGNPRRIIAGYPFASLIIAAADGHPYATQTPMHFETDAPDEVRLIGHLARANPQAALLSPGMPVLALFTGPHAYISSTCYVEQPTVPTWDYVSAQVRGRLTPIDDDAGQLAVLERVIAASEAFNGTNWTMADAPEGKVDQLLPRIRSFRIEAETIEGVAKLSQTHPAGDRARIVGALQRRGSEGDRAIAALIEGLGD
ncbi:FMN-binding negative transcriptional regulator [Pacificimonas flava]|uniref:FMN-binding negative transcriptional regulator n=1 Tax=Pacificimonas flava TaxID=1234595 RepID=UPI00155389AF|nr:FMN-binding negative transcriptional regulator [Pacificimonas flava]